jgi:signal transduction histidine kinase
VSERTADLVAANDEIQRFAYIVTHDLRAPLVNIMGFTAELETSFGQIRAYLKQLGNPAEGDVIAAEAHRATDADLPEAIGFIRSSTTKMDGLIGAILKLAREGGRVLRPETVDLTELLQASVKTVQHQLTDADGEVSLKVETAAIVCDRLALGQVIGNLLDNAIKYRAKGRPLRIAITSRTPSADWVRIEVADNGRGIAPQDHERVFELFRRAGVQDQPGEGIGLPYVRRIVRNLGGDIKMQSVLGEGTTFVVILPRTMGPLKGDKSA